MAPSMFASLVSNANAVLPKDSLKPSPILKPVSQIDIQASTLTDLLYKASLSPAKCIIYDSTNDSEILLPYKDLWKTSGHDAELVQKLDVRDPHRIILLHLRSFANSIRWFWAVTRAGYIPALSTPLSQDAYSRQQHLEHLKSLFDDPIVITEERLLPELEVVPTLRTVTVESLKFKVTNIVDEAEAGPNHGSDNDIDKIATLALTSGSSGRSKAVALTNRQMLSSLEGKSCSLGTNNQSVILNWIALDHVAGLVEAHFHALALGVDQVHVQTSDLLDDPLLFLRLMAENKVTHTFTPNFFLSMVNDELARCELDDPIFSLDLSAIKNITSAGEASVVSMVDSLLAKLRKMRVSQPIIRSAYGLTESCAGMTYEDYDSSYESDERHEFASIGKPMPGSRARVVLDDGEEAAVGVAGSLEITGPSVFSQYFNNPKATSEAFTHDGWFKTGDNAVIDTHGKINLVGRAKELLNIRGVVSSPTELENAIDRANIEGVMSSYIAIFASREQNTATEGYTVIFGSSIDPTQKENHIETAYKISKLLSGIIGTRPTYVVPIFPESLHKSNLGKLSRANLRIKFEEGVFDEYKIRSIDAIEKHGSMHRVAPKTQTEHDVIAILCELFELPEDAVSVDSSIFEIGVTSLSLYRFEKRLRTALRLSDEISLINLLTNPVIEAIAEAIDNSSTRQFNPVSKLQTRGNKLPLWLLPPASGNVLSFLPLSRTMTDRPLYALTSRGLNAGEPFFSSINDMVSTLYSSLKATQSHGPYAILGYSLGSTIAYELARRLEENGDEVQFCAVVDSPPHVKSIIGGLDWTDAAVLTCYFLELIGQDQVQPLTDHFRGQDGDVVISQLLERARPVQLERLGIDKTQLGSIVGVIDNYSKIIQRYSPSGKVRNLDVFYCTPLRRTASSRQVWVDDYLRHWQDFAEQPIGIHECDGDHADMLNPKYIEGFKTLLNQVMEKKGI